MEVKSINTYYINYIKYVNTYKKVIIYTHIYETMRKDTNKILYKPQSKVKFSRTNTDTYSDIDRKDYSAGFPATLENLENLEKTGISSIYPGSQGIWPRNARNPGIWAISAWKPWILLNCSFLSLNNSLVELKKYMSFYHTEERWLMPILPTSRCLPSSVGACDRDHFIFFVANGQCHILISVPCGFE